MQRRANEQGMTLIEVLVTTVVLTIGIIGIISLQLNAVRANGETRQRDEANRFLAAMSEQISMTAYGDLIASVKSDDSDKLAEELQTWKGDPFNPYSKGIELDTGTNRYALRRFVLENGDETKTVFFCVQWQGVENKELMFRTVLKVPDREG